MDEIENITEDINDQVWYEINDKVVDNLNTNVFYTVWNVISDEIWDYISNNLKNEYSFLFLEIANKVSDHVVKMNKLKEI
jgi:hypothetical protein